MPTGLGFGEDSSEGGLIRAVYVAAVLGGEGGKERVSKREDSVASTLWVEFW